MGVWERERERKEEKSFSKRKSLIFIPKQKSYLHDMTCLEEGQSGCVYLKKKIAPDTSTNRSVRQVRKINTGGGGSK